MAESTTKKYLEEEKIPHYKKKVFRKLDVDGDGTVSSLEFKRGLRKLRIGDYLTEKDVRRCGSGRAPGECVIFAVDLAKTATKIAPLSRWSSLAEPQPEEPFQHHTDSRL